MESDAAPGADERPAPSDTDRGAVERLFGIDLRSLALFRVVVGSIVLLDLFSRSRFLTAHYTDQGVLPRRELYVYLLQPWHWSLHTLNGSGWYEALLFITAGVFALAMIFGYRTRIAVFLVWVFTASLQYRNPMINNSGDMLLRSLLFWSMFLPLGARYSIDASVNSADDPAPKRILSAASAALLLQTCVVYWFTAALKDNHIWRVDHSAVYYALSIEQFVTPLGKILYGYPSLLAILTIFTLYLEILGPAAAFLPFRTAPIRVVVILLFFALHFGFGTAMRLGFFPWISAASWLPFLPLEFWDGIFRRLRTPERLGLRIYFDGDCGFCKRMARLVRTFLLLPETLLLPAQSDPSILEDMRRLNSMVIVDAAGRRTYKFEGFLTICRQSPLVWWIAPLLALPPFTWIGRKSYEAVASHRNRTGWIVRFLEPRPLRIRPQRATQWLVGILFGYIVLWNIRGLDPEKYGGFLPEQLDPIGYVTGLSQNWDMFAPYPLVDDGWYVITAKLHNGKLVDIFRGGKAVSWDKPAWVVDDYVSQRWRKYHMNLYKKGYAGLRRPYAQYLCWNWNRHHDYDEQLDGLDIYYMLERTMPDYTTQPVRKLLLYAHHNVPDVPNQNVAPARNPALSSAE